MNSSPISIYHFKEAAIQFEVVDIQKILSMKEKSLVAHRLRFHQILVITDGSGFHEVDFKVIEFHKSTIIPVAMGQVQRFEPNSEMRGYAIVFTSDFLIKESLDYNYLFNFTIFIHNITPILCECNESIEVLVGEMLREQFAGGQFEQEAYLRNLLLSFLIQIERKKRSYSEIEPNQTLNLYLNFRCEIEQNISYKLKIVDICEKLSISPKQLNRQLKQYHNTTAKKYIDERILLEIKRLLSYSTLSMKEIAYRIGFDDPTNFTKYFKGKTGQLPSVYRLRYQ
ncbi:helix-turn-helix domain-containing protein [Halosquirtibacter xylanolyticus]|uniref:helix-turn-helix domain-containing protein n=1 Tax=Halosquirtibacter xylanolyticus TaxID=3374599 RepID=UPI0037480278|nr:helix-turn-helix domain-containing protein [Prolixibacteraceae bacterium]